MFSFLLCILATAAPGQVQIRRLERPEHSRGGLRAMCPEPALNEGPSAHAAGRPLLLGLLEGCPLT